MERAVRSALFRFGQCPPPLDRCADDSSNAGFHDACPVDLPMRTGELARDGRPAGDTSACRRHPGRAFDCLFYTAVLGFPRLSQNYPQTGGFPTPKMLVLLYDKRLYFRKDYQELLKAAVTHTSISDRASREPDGFRTRPGDVSGCDEE
ncbi:hypothetical protein [Burkholderia sp. MSMB1589WGS]|uniref:hypothetical protein n=1 Tax=Burkholderia sp. MSMB1589WGS TaxID=1636425 RepID=UPI0032B79FEF